MVENAYKIIQYFLNYFNHKNLVMEKINSLSSKCMVIRSVDDLDSLSNTAVTYFWSTMLGGKVFIN